jgi:zinc-finger of transposase IS204/IS1001/IS1096/IS1165
VPEDMASALLGLDGMRVTAVEDDAAGGLRVYAASSAALAACPGCGRPSGAVKEWVSAQPKNVAFGGRPVSLVLVKRRLYCTGSSCWAGSFTEPVAAVALPCRVTTRLRGPDGAANLGDSRCQWLAPRWWGIKALSPPLRHEPWRRGRQCLRQIAAYPVRTRSLLWAGSPAAFARARRLPGCGWMPRSSG